MISTHMNHGVVEYSREVVEELSFSGDLVRHYQSDHSISNRPPEDIII